jgi:RHS repeat-associated protein
MGRLLAGAVIVALVLPTPAQAWAQAQANQRASEEQAKRSLEWLKESASDPSSDSPDSSRGLPAPPPRAAAGPSEVLPVSLLPKTVQRLSGSGADFDPWSLFDGNSTTALNFGTPDPVRLAVDLQQARSLAAITLLGPTEGTLSAFAQDGPSLRPLASLQAVPIRVGANEWKRVPIEDRATVSRVVLEWTPTSPTGPAEIGLWGRWLPPRDATDKELTDRVLANAAPGAFVANATPERVTAARVSLGAAEPQSGVVHVQLPADPRSWSRAFLVYELTGLGHFTQAVRQINGLTPRGGARPAESGGRTIEGGLQVEEISPEWLRLGDNEIRFSPLPDAGAPEYSVQRVRILGTGHSSLAEARMADAKVSAASSMQHFAFDSASQPHDLVFELLRPSEGHVFIQAAGPKAPAPLRINLHGLATGWHHIGLDSLPNTTAVDVSADRAAGGGRARSEGLLPAVSEVVVTASPVSNDAEARGIAISYPLHGECRNHEAWVTGFVAAQRGDEPVELRANGQDVRSSLAPDKSFAVRLAEPSDKQKTPWTATLEATLSSGKVVRRAVRLDPCIEDVEVADKATAEDDGAPYAQVVRAGEKKTIAFAGVKLEIPAGAVDRDVRITVRPLVADQVRAMSPRVANVSPEHRAYRFGPSGLKFKKPVKITLPYDASALKEGETERELFAFYYDEPLGTWQRIGRYDTGQAGSLTSLTEHFTDYITGILSTPDEPGVKSFGSNEMKDIKVADPGAGVDFIAPPEANSSGGVNLGYPLELPPGRNGVEPSLVFSYSSEKPNGWMGMGWDIHVSAVEVDTRFGVPRYDEFNYGRDNYMIDGEPIVPTMAVSNNYVRRVEGQFATIVRNVDANNCVTSWTVTDKHGTVSTYGGAGAVLAQPGNACNVFRWGLSSVQDTFGNRMQVSYATDTGTASGSADTFVELYPQQMDYTAHVVGSTTDLAPAYRVLFVRDAGNVRKDVIISGRAGFQERTRFRLDHVDVLLLNGSAPPTTIRRYQLAYEQESLTHFYKSLLTSIGQQGLGAAVQLDQHTFQYGAAQTVAIDSTKTGISGFGTQVQWGTAQNGSALSQTEDEMGGGSGTFGIGLPIVSLTASAGGNGGSETSRLMMLDFNGDGLPDLGSSGSGFMNFLHPELSVPSPGSLHFQPQSISGLESLGHTSKLGWSASGGFSFSGIGASASYTSTSTDDDAIVVDIDGDGWIDRAWVDNGKLKWLKNDGKNHFVVPSSASNQNTLTPNTKDPNASFLGSASQNGGLVRINPLVRWTAPFAGPVTIQGSIQKLSAGGNGVDVSIYKNGSLLWSHPFGPSDLTACAPTGTTDCDPASSGLQTALAVGDSLYFMTSPHHDPNGPASQLGLESTANQVSWDPLITYDGKPGPELKEPYGLPVYRFSQATDHRLLRPEMQWVATAKGTVHVQNPSPFDAPLAKSTTSDDVKIRIFKHPRQAPETSQLITPPGEVTVAASSTSAIALDATIDVDKGDSITLEATSDTPVDFNRLGLAPRITYTNYCRNVSSSDTPFCGSVNCVKTAPDQALQCPIAMDPEADNPVPADILSQVVHVSYPFTQLLGGPTQALPTPATQTLAVTGTLFFSNLLGPATVLVQGVNQLHYKMKVMPTFRGQGSLTINTSADVPAGGELMVTVFPEQLLSGSLGSGPVTVSGSVSAGGMNVPINVVYRDADFGALNPDHTPVDPMSGGFHRWSAGFYNGDLPEGFVPANIVFPLDGSGNPRNNPTKFFFGVPQHDTNLTGSWSGPGGANVAAGQWNASRGSARLGNGGGGGLNSLRNADTWNFELSGHVPLVSLAVNQGRTKSARDFFDINGDRYPDAVSADGTVQYGDGAGGFKWTQPVDGVSSLDALRVVDHGSFRGTISIGDIQLINDTGSDGSVRKSITTGFALGTDYGLSATSIDWVDVNGDGLPDAVQRSADDGSPGQSHNFTVRLNYGYRLGPATSWPANAWSTTSANSATGVAGKTIISAQNVTDLVNFFGGDVGVNGVRLQDTGSNNVNIGGGFDSGGISIGGGGGFSFGVSRTLVDMVDVNGDGLPDQVIRVAGDQVPSDPQTQYLRVRLNLGDRFDTNDMYLTVPNWDSAIDSGTDFAFSGNINDSLGFRRSKSFTSSFEFKVCFIFCVGASGFYESGSGWAHSNFEDLDGDGRPDMVFKSKDSTAVWAKINQLPKELNLLTKVNRPLGGSFEIQYERAGNLVRRDLSPPTDEPTNKYVMARLDVADGRGNHYARSFTYDPSGYHDRVEREDYGFAKVTTTRLHQNNTAYSTKEVNYNNQDFYRKGLVSRAITRDAASNVFNVQDYTYATSGFGTCASPALAVFPAELSRTSGYFEGTTTNANATPTVSTSETRTWDCLGNLTDMVDKGDASANNDVTYHIDYKDPALLAAKIFKPSKVTAKDHFAKILRDRRATYDSRGALLTVNEVVIGGVDPITGLPNTGDPAINPTWKYGHDAFGNVNKVVDPGGYTLTYLYDPTTQTHRTQVLDSFGYASTAVPDLRFGVVASETDVNGSFENRTYDDFGRLESVDGPYDVGTSHHTISFSYSEVGVPVSNGTPANNPTPAFAVTSHRDVQHPTQPIVTSTFADGLDRIIQTKKSLARDTGTGVEVGMSVTGAIAYDDQGRLSAQDQPYFDKTLPPTAMASQTTPPSVRTEFDVLDRAIVTKTPLLPNSSGTDPFKWATTITTYGIGKINGVSRLSTTVADANVNASTAVSPLPGFQHVELRGVRGNVLEVVEQNRLAGSSTPTTLTTFYGYNALDELLAVTDAKGNVTRAIYDTLGRIVTLTSQDAGRTDFEFDLGGNLAAKQTANLATGFQLIRYVYEFNRLKKVDYPNSADITYDYGSSTEAGPLGLNRASRIKQETSEAGTKVYEYDALGNVNEETWKLNRIGSAATTMSRTFAYDYDSFGRLLNIYYPGASKEVISYGYDAGGSLDTVTGVTAKGTTTKYVQHIGYDEFEQKTLITVGNGITTKFSYDPLTRRLSGIDASQRDPALVKAGAPARPFQQVTYRYDPVGNVTQIANAAPFDPTQTGTVKVGPATENFGYDDLYQLKSVDGLHQTSATNRYHYGLSMTYDPISNVVQKAQTSETQKLSGSTVTQTTKRTEQTYTSAFAYTGGRPHAPTQVDDTVPSSTTPVKRTFSYDNNGNQSSWRRTTGTTSTRNVAYSDDNRVTSVTQDNVVLQESLYDAEGQRLVKRANESAQTAYFGEYLTVRDAVPTTKHIYAGDIHVASKFVPNDANEDCATCTDRASVNYFHSDQLGSTTFVTDESQNLIAHEQYFPSGELWVDQTSDTSHTRQPYLFNGKELDVETGLYYFGARYYDPRIGLWTSPDPILSDYMRGDTNRGVHLPQNLALYSYSWNNPVTIRDPNGKCPMCITALIGAAIGGAIGGGVYLARAAITGGDVTARGLLGATAGGAVSGAVAGLTGGASLVAQVGAGAAAGVAGGVVSRGIETGDVSKAFDPRAMVTDAAIGGVMGGAAYGIGKGVNALRGGAKGPVPRPCACFVGGTPVATDRGEVPIEELRLGDRVSAGNAQCANEHLAPDAQSIHLMMRDPEEPLDSIELDVVRPLSWLNAEGLQSDGSLWVDLQELGISGWATVTGIGPGPEEQLGSGCLVLAKVQHVASEVLRIRLSGTHETLEVTPSHRLYLEGSGWTAAGDFAPGMYLRTDRGPVAIDSIEIASPNQRVYNIEVGLEHTYRVGDAEVWSHNACRWGSGKGPHTMESTVTREGEVISQSTSTSGNMTAEEAALGFPKSTLATHTELREAVKLTPTLKPGDAVKFKGQYKPCTSCKGAMNTAARKTGAKFEYEWDGNKWVALAGKKKK